MKKIIFGITSLSIGGAEKVLIDLIDALKNEYEITVFTLYGKGELEKLLPSNVKLKKLYQNSYMEMSKLKRIQISIRLLLFKKSIYKKYIDNGYDTEIAFLEGPITSLFGVKSKNNLKKIAWVHTDISKIFGDTIKSKIKKVLNSSNYKKYDKIVFVSKGNMEKFKKLYPKSDENKLVVINNYINKKNVIEKAKENVEIYFDGKNINFVTVARLVEAKAIDRLIKIHAKLIKEGYKHHIYVVGDGPLNKQLQEQINQEHVNESFHLLGAKANPYPYIKSADYFCLLSYYEGYGMVLEEAKILKKFIIITNNDSKEAIENYENKLILENNEEAIYEGVKDVLKNPENYKVKIENKEYDSDDLIKKIKEIV